MNSNTPLQSSGTRASSAQLPHVEFLGLRFSGLSQHEVLGRIIDDCGEPFRYVVTPNSYHVVLVHNDPSRLLPIYREAWLSLCDSRILHALARFDGYSFPLVPGSDLVAALIAELNRRSPLGERRQVLIVGPPSSAAGPLRRAYPGVIVDILSAPAGLGEDAALRLEVARDCLRRSWDILLLCVGCPAQELIAHELAGLGRSSGVALCAGAAVDFLTGARVRAPIWMQRLSLEWAHRLAQEPNRLWRRYLIESPQVLRIFLADRLSRRRRH
jgi:N-acetylglucosaminyldiphosphoundecaprenol N-acetyl-beta-D-mannosaminyltransferase